MRLSDIIYMRYYNDPKYTNRLFVIGILRCWFIFKLFKYIDMKKTITLLLLLISISVSATFVSKDSCIIIAKNAFYEQTGIKPAVRKTSNCYLYRKGKKPYLWGYVVNFPTGWVGVQNNIKTRPVFTIGFTGEFDPDKIPNNSPMYRYLQQRGEMNVAAEHLKDVHTNEWDRLFNAPGHMVHANAAAIPKLTQSSYNQEPYVNDSCPRNAYGTAVVGCGAQSMVCIFRYWGYAKGSGSYSYTPPGYTKQTVDFSKATYDFSQIPYTNSKSAALAQLMYHAGVSVAMEYGASAQGGSGCYTDGSPSCKEAYSKFFGYKPVTSVYQQSFTSAAWDSIMKAELTAKRVIQYFGYDAASRAGHTWCIVGYDASGLFAIDWGWGNYGNGFFSLAKLSVMGYDFSYQAGALIGIEPAVPITPGQPPVVPPVTPPIQPTVCNSSTNLITSNITTTGATFTWTPDVTNTAWRIGLTTFDATGSGITNFIPATSPYTYTGGKPSTKYEWYVNSMCGTLQKNTGGRSFTTLAGTTPPPLPIDTPKPCLPNTLQHVPTSKTCTVSWNKLANDSIYKLEYRAVGGTWVAIDGITGTSALITKLTDGTAHETRLTKTCYKGAVNVATGNFTTLTCP